jgi:NAD(P)H-binding
MADSHVNCVSVMRRHGIRKIVTMSAFGVADSWSQLHFLLRLTISKSNMTYQFEDHGLVDKEMKGSGMDYVLARPVMLKEGDAKPIIEHGNVGDKRVGLLSGITRKSVAKFLLDAAEKSDWNKMTPVLTN